MSASGSLSRRQGMDVRGPSDDRSIGHSPGGLELTSMRKRSRPTASASLGLVDAVETLLHRIDALAAVVHELEGENARLRSAGAARTARLTKQVTALQLRVKKLRGRTAGPARPVRRSGDAARPAASLAQRTAPRKPRRIAAASGRPKADRPAVSDTVMRAAIGKLGAPTAAEIAREITRGGEPVSGRAVRFFAERAGATPFRDDAGIRRYRLAPLG